jgi:succinate-acetate transporter protein
MSAEINAGTREKEIGDSVNTQNGAGIAPQMSAEEHEVARAAARFGYGPLAQVNTAESRLPAFGGEFQPGLYRSVEARKFANPAPLGLSAFALTTFLLSCINMGARDITEPSFVIAAAFGYGGLVQLLAGMWEMAVGNTFGATALSSYGGFWIAIGIILTPGGFQILSTLEAGDSGSPDMFYNSFGIFLMGWFIFTTILLLCTLKSTVAFFTLFLWLDLAFLLLGIGYLQRNSADAPNPPVIKAGGFFGLLAAFTAWYNALAGIADTSNSFFIIPVLHFPWSATGRANKQAKTEREVV